MKKIKNLLTLFVAVSSLTFVSCSNDDSSSDDPGTSGNDYWPTAINNTWIYENNGADLPESKIIATQSISGNTYYKFTPQTNGGVTNNNFIRKSNGSYFLRTSDSTINISGLSGTQTGFEFIILKDNLAVDATWSGSYDQTTTYTGYPAIEQSTTYTGTVLAKDATEIVEGVTYTNVIKVNIYQETNSPGSTSIINSEYWFAKNIGLIKSEIYTGSGSSTSTLKSHTLF